MASYRSFDIPTPVKISAAWAATVLCYIYCDYFALYVPGKMQEIQDGEGPFGAVSQGSLLGAGLLLMVPSAMVFLSIGMGSALSRILNIALGACYTFLMLLLAAMVSWHFYRVFAIVEALLTATIVWLAWNWPKRHDAS
jgi:hypothetical protein